MNDDLSKRVKTAAVFLIAVIVTAAWLLSSFISSERERDLKDWEITLSVMADNRVVAIEQWLAGQFSPLLELSENGSVQLYVSQLGLQQQGQSSEPEPAQTSYLRNLIKATAIRTGIVPLGAERLKIPANLKLPSDSGLALFNQAGDPLVATPSMPELSEQTIKLIRSAIKTGKKQISDIHLNERLQPVMGFIVPVPGLEGLSDTTKASGVLVAIKEVSFELYPLLASNTQMIEQDEAYLVQRMKNDSLLYLTPLADGSKALTKQLPMNRDDIIAAHAIQNPSTFAKRADYQGQPGFFVSRELSLTPWVLIQKISSQEVLQDSQSHQQRLIIFFVVTVIAMVGLLIASWQHGVSIRERESALLLQETALQLNSKNQLLQSITGNVTDYIWLLDNNDHMLFANRPLTKLLGMSEKDIEGKTLSSLFGSHVKNSIAKVTNQVKIDCKVHTKELTLEIGTKVRQFYATAVPIALEEDNQKQVLVTLHDMTDLRHSEEQRYLLYRQLIQALMRAIDLHDPFSANHSARVSEVAMAIANGMNLSTEDCSTLDTASSLCNIGKILIPKELLTKTEALTDEEKGILQSETDYARQVLSDIDFPGDVLGTIIQKNEHLDGTGQPLGVSDASLKSPARILCIANAFVAMVSPRAYREKMPTRKALDNLLQNGHWYDRAALAALFHVVENQLKWDEDTDS